jgi:hypothetical protein
MVVLEITALELLLEAEYVYELEGGGYISRDDRLVALL